MLNVTDIVVRVSACVRRCTHVPARSSPCEHQRNAHDGTLSETLWPETTRSAPSWAPVWPRRDTAFAYDHCGLRRDNNYWEPPTPFARFHKQIGIFSRIRDRNAI